MTTRPIDLSRHRTTPLVLVVDGRHDECEMYAQYLRHCGFDVIEADNGVQGIALAREKLPDVVSLDMALPVLDGFAVCRHLRHSADTRAIRLIAVSSLAYPADVAQARAAGCDRVLIKPCLPDQLLAEIRSLIVRPPAAGPPH